MVQLWYKMKGGIPDLASRYSVVMQQRATSICE